MGTIKCGFWTSRFLISPDEFNGWIDLWQQEGFSIQATNLASDIKQQYKEFYQNRMNLWEGNLSIPLVCYSMVKDNYQSSFRLTSKEFSCYPKGKGMVMNRLFIELSAPKQYAVPANDGIHFTYEDILQKEPKAHEVFILFDAVIKQLTKPLYYMERPAYSIRISKQAYVDLQKSAFIKDAGAGLSSKW